MAKLVALYRKPATAAAFDASLLFDTRAHRQEGSECPPDRLIHIHVSIK